MHVMQRSTAAVMKRGSLDAAVSISEEMASETRKLSAMRQLCVQRRLQGLRLLPLKQRVKRHTRTGRQC